MNLSPMVIPHAVVNRHVDGDHVACPLLTKWLTCHTRAVEALQGAHKPDLVLMTHAGRAARLRSIRHTWSIRL